MQHIYDLLVLACFKSFVRFNVMCFCSSHISINIYSTVSWYILIDKEFCTLYIDAVHFFLTLIFCLYSAYYYMISLNDFRSIFLYEFKLNKSAAETVRKINLAFRNDSANERTVRRWFAKFRSRDILASKMSSEMVDIQ